MSVEGIKNWGYFTDIEDGEWYNPVEELKARGYEPWIITPETDTVEKSLMETAKRLGKIPSDEEIAISRKPHRANRKFLEFCSNLILGGKDIQ